MIYNKKKRAFTLIELMAVISIVAILSAVLWSALSGYINRSKKLNIVVQARNVAEYATSVGINPDSDIKLSELKDSNIFSDYDGKLDTLQDDIKYSTLRAISQDEDALNKIKLQYNKIIEWTGENPYKKSNY